LTILTTRDIVRIKEVIEMFAERLRELRKEKGITQIDLAKDLEVANGTVAMWEIGKRMPSIELVIALSDYFGVTIDYLFARTDERHGYKTKTPPELESVGVENVVKTNSEPLTPDEVAAIRQMLEQNKN